MNDTEPKVVRYHFEPGPSHTYHMAANEIGSWVRHSDYACLAAELEDLKEEERLNQEAFQRIMEERCPSDEDHCTCVPILRRENERLREALGEYGHHKPRCKLDPCDCGILEALKEKP